jgi:hypothetical protein
LKARRVIVGSHDLVRRLADVDDVAKLESTRASGFLRVFLYVRVENVLVISVTAELLL